MHVHFCRQSASLELQNTITNSVDDVARWMRSNRLQLNTAKTEIPWSTTGRRSHHLPQLRLRDGTDDVIPTAVVQNLGIYHVGQKAAPHFSLITLSNLNLLW